MKDWSEPKLNLLIAPDKGAGTHALCRNPIRNAMGKIDRDKGT
jgi:hypothetical protein